MPKLPTPEPSLLGNRVFINENVYVPKLGYRGREPFDISVTCPHCSKVGIFAPVHGTMDAGYTREFALDGPLGGHMGAQASQFIMGVRICPNSSCQGCVAIVAEVRNNV